ncbi:hypothetical protein AMTRI_Chr11g158560 [Amborella trichopoda]|uniref:XS domain-containing protein n=1 Tax=Amborella trichopoda TaxID=13333 RepID=W1NWP8_AMBTC|nr:protein SUPPRESSOR OF GENE SILENCING 3 homolog [Amborella trichopoda]ERM99743.1 hypothetical protein AMTR_s00099p00113800 [Amborella trichopoda]|eukprot:XP_020519012.1 protein SUPPRESSOR OF GENE SILENCING 3 homolog [Amborella trichopoda]
MPPKKNGNPGGANSSPKTKGPTGTQELGSSSRGSETSWADASEFSADIQDDEGVWEVPGRKSRKPKSLQNMVQSGPRPSNLAARAPNYNWHQQTHDPKKQVNNRGNPRSQASNWSAAYMGPPSVITPPLQNGWQWRNRAGSSSQTPNKPNDKTQVGETSLIKEENRNSDEDDVRFSGNSSENEDLDEDSEDEMLSDGNYDSDVSQKSHSELKKSKWCKKFFEKMDELSVEEINESSRQWHCPACYGGIGAIDWYTGMQPLVTHAKTKGANRVRLHRKFAELLEEELQRRGTSAIPAGELFGKWKGLRDEVADHEIVWPPMVIIQNTQLDRDENDTWLGMGNAELVEYFKAYMPSKAKHSYGPQGHRGLSVLIFDPSAIGYLDAERLHKHFMEEGRDRDGWDRRRVLYYPGGKRVLYGYLATNEDMDLFNRHCHGKSRLKFDMRSYQEMVVGPMKQMSEDNQQLIFYKHRVAKVQMESKALQETVSDVGRRLRLKDEENKTFRQKAKDLYEEKQKEMDAQEKFYKEQIKVLQDKMQVNMCLQENALQELQMQSRKTHVNELEQAKHANILGSNEAGEHKREEISKVMNILDNQEKDIQEYEAERDKLLLDQANRRKELKQKHHEEEIKMEEEFQHAMNDLFNKYTARACPKLDAPKCP